MNLSSSIHINRSGIIGLLLVGAVIVLIYHNTSDALHNKLGDNGGDLISLKELLSAAIDAAIRGGHEVRRIRDQASLNIKNKGNTKEGVNDPVTDGDMKSHIVMFYSIKKAFPNLEIISEEHDTKALDRSSVAAASVRDPDIESLVISDNIVFMRDVKVWIDPLDATKEYTEDLRQYVTTMVGVAVRGVPTLGVVHRPFTNVTHWGWVDYGVSPDLQLIKQNPTPSLHTAGDPPAASVRVIVSMSHQGAVRDVATHAFGDGTVIIPAAGAGYKILEVIRGAADVYVHLTAIKKWDLCAGHAILRAVGGRLTTLAGGDNAVTYGDREDYKISKGLLATAGHHDHYLDKLKLAQNKQ